MDYIILLEAFVNFSHEKQNITGHHSIMQTQLPGVV